MKFLLAFLMVISMVDRSFQKCTSTVAITECQGEPLPLFLPTYKSVLQFKQRGNLGEISSGAFAHVPEVKTLYLSSNSIRRLERGSFKGLVKVDKLFLSDNLIESIPNGAFLDCQSMSFIDLSVNKIKTIENRAFDELVSLEELWLNSNLLEALPAALGSLHKLKKLNVRGNNIKSLSAGILTPLRDLEILDLESNKIRDVPVDAFRGLDRLEEINLKDNYLSRLNATNLISNLQSLKTIKLNINDFVCTTLRAVIAEFSSRGIRVARGLSKANVTVNGIACKLQ